MSQAYDKGLTPGFSSPPLALRCAIRVSAPEESGSRDASESKTELPAARLSRSSRPRSNDGCRTCRQRKVKCDENHPRCGPCSRLSKECLWGRQWRFQDDSPRVHRKYNVIKAGLRTQASDLARYQAQSLSAQDANSLPIFTSLVEESDREQKALTRVPGTYNVILTPDSFARLPEYGGTGRKLLDQTGDQYDDDDDPDVIVLSEFENTPYVRLTPTTSDSAIYRDTRSANVIFQVHHVPEIRRDFADYGIRDADNANHLQLYRTTILKKIMPLGTRFNLHIGAANEDVVTSLAETFPPLYHAICSITMLTLALRGQPNLLTGAFRHYNRALSACLSYTDIDSDHFFYLHFLLLLYDISCATQNWPQDNQMWAQHLKHLSRIIHKQNPRPHVSRLKAYVSWYILFLDAQSCLAGNEEAGTYVRAYLVNGCSLPQWPLSPTSPAKAPPRGEPGAFMSIHHLTLHLFTTSAKLSQLALGMRQNPRQDQATIDEREESIAQFNSTLRADWLERCPPSLRPGNNTSIQNIPQIARSTFEFAQLQFSIISLYLHTSMYPGQRLHATRYREEDACHCSFILSTAAKAVASRDIHNHHMVTAIFLAGYVTMIPQEKALAIKLLRAMESAGISRSVSRSMELLQFVQKEQLARQLSGRCPEEVDWLQVAQEKGIKSINFGL